MRVVAEKLCKLDLKLTTDVEPLVVLYLFSSFLELIDLLDVFYHTTENTVGTIDVKRLYVV